MSQLTVTKFYNTRKRDRVNKDVKLLKELSVSTNKTSEIKSNLEKTETVEYDKCEKDSLKSIEVEKSLKSKKNVQSKTSKVTKTTKKKNVVQTTVTNFYPSQSVKNVNEKQKELSEKTLPPKAQAKKDVLINNTKSILVTIQDKESSDLKRSDSSNSIVQGYEISNLEAVKDNQVFHSPKRNLSGVEEGSPSKRPALAINREISNNDGISSSNNTPSKSKESPVKKKLQFEFSPSKLQKIGSPNAKGQHGSPRKILSESEKLDALINNSRSKILFSSNLENLKKSLASFSEKTSKLKEFQSSPYKITSVVSAPNKTEKSALPSRPAHEQFKYLAEPETSSLLLPFKYKLLSEMFRSMDTVISILNNRKETITFEKVRDGVQKMTKRNFTKMYLGQIVTVFPSAYTLTLERGNKKTDGPECQLIISPNLAIDKDNKSSKSNTYICMQPQCLIDRRNEFHNNILKIVKQHHQNFLKKVNFPSVSDDSIKYWHPKFPLDSVPDIQVAPLPVPPQSKICTAKDVLNKVKDSFKNKKLEKALESVAEKSAHEDKKIDISIPKPSASKSALKGICSDLLEKIRARESAMLLQTMTRSPGEVKRKAMMERLPNIVNILWHYFIAERKAAIPVDVAVEKIIHSLNSLTSPSDVEEHLKLITETFPGWLTFIQIPKGLYITIDKKRNINEMLANLPH
ncbi:DNA replication factor Cdt1 [Trichonephila clavata]|uniref:DNA replication factor Cdt1 n=1 Tax=Trichonephila clavata TaxID=2740835 RepID=A0A8X6IHD6_TRICU|nr:DNA replication factor Cdt1 [Trichonephila clavata]